MCSAESVIRAANIEYGGEHPMWRAAGGHPRGSIRAIIQALKYVERSVESKVVVICRK